MDRAFRTRRRTSHYDTALLLVLLVAAALRLYRLPELPLGFHYDEAANGILANEIARGLKTPVFIPAYTGKEVLFFYWTALWMKLLGATPLALRLSAALAGLMTVAATVWAVRELLHGQRYAKWVALLTGAFLATSFWHLVLSRYGFRAVTQPLMQTLTMAALWRGLRLTERRCQSQNDRWSWRAHLWLILAGLFCGLTAYTYLAARAFPIPLAAALLALLLADRDGRPSRIGQITLFVAVAALTLTPLAHYWLAHPGSFSNRIQQVAATTWSEAWKGIDACARMFFTQGDPYIRFNIPGQPVFDPIIAILWLVGIVALLAPRLLRIQSPASAPRYLAFRVFLLTYLPVMVLPSALAFGEIIPSNLRTAGLLPFIYLFPALGIAAIKSQITDRKWLNLPYWSLVTLILAAMTLVTTSTYFGNWAPSADLYYAADGDLADVADYLKQTDSTATTPYVASKHYQHPTLAFLAEDYGRVRWITGGQTVVIPAQAEGLLIFPRSASQDLGWVRSVLPPESLLAEVTLSGPDGAPAFRAYPVRPGSAWAPTYALKGNLAHVAQLLGYDIVGEPRSGGRVEVAVWWHIVNVPNVGDYGHLARLTDPWGFVWGEARPFRYPSEQWTAGEWVVDHLSIPVAPGTPPGPYDVRVSLYSASTNSRLPIVNEAGRYGGTDVRLPVRLDRATTPIELQDLPIRNRLEASARNLTLLGFNLDTMVARPGEPLYLTLFWQAVGPARSEVDVVLTLGDMPLYTGAPVHTTYPTSEWAEGEVVADRYDPRLGRDLVPGAYPLRLQLGAFDTEDNLILELGTVEVQAIDRSFEIPPISHLLTSTLGGRIALLGYDLPTSPVAPGDVLTLTLYWQSLTETEEDYTVFTHLLAPNGSTSGQRDNPPAGGTYPTSLWMSGEIIADVYEIPVRTDAAPGEHRLEVGMYLAETGERLPTGATDNAVVLGPVMVSSP